MYFKYILFLARSFIIKKLSKIVINLKKSVIVECITHTLVLVYT